MDEDAKRHGSGIAMLLTAIAETAGVPIERVLDAAIGGNRTVCFEVVNQSVRWSDLSPPDEPLRFEDAVRRRSPVGGTPIWRAQKRPTFVEKQVVGLSASDANKAAMDGEVKVRTIYAAYANARRRGEPVDELGNAMRLTVRRSDLCVPGNIGALILAEIGAPPLETPAGTYTGLTLSAELEPSRFVPVAQNLPGGHSTELETAVRVWDAVVRPRAGGQPKVTRADLEKWLKTRHPSMSTNQLDRIVTIAMPDEYKRGGARRSERKPAHQD